MLLKMSSKALSFTGVKGLSWATASRPDVSFWGKENGTYSWILLVTYCLGADCVLSAHDTASHLFFTPCEEVLLHYRENK